MRFGKMMQGRRPLSERSRRWKALGERLEKEEGALLRCWKTSRTKMSVCRERRDDV
jgi:hypothetical protein